MFTLSRICRGAEYRVYNPFITSLMLAFEAQRVIELRLVRLAWGGKEGLAEAQSMVIEKVHAAAEATTTLMLGGSPETVIARYREHVAANTKRLSAP
ncbi:hypothetical protein JOE48_002655 [Methylobacterium sp. PvR107]|nr:hypothetical protein [Methylobacterium sp. PvR107]